MAPPAKKPKNMCKFRSEFTVGFPSIVASKKSQHHAHCTACKTDFLVSHGGRNDVTNHVSTKKHLEAASASTYAAPISAFFSRNSEEELFKKQVTRAELLFVFFLIEHNMPMAIADHARPLFKTMFPDSKIAQSFSCARTKAAAMTKCLAQHYSSNLVSILQSQPFALATDGSNDGGSSQIYPLVVRFFDKVKGAVVTQLLSVVECVGCSTGENIFEMLNKELSKFSIPWKNVVSFCSDNASVMMGVHKGVVKFIKDLNPGIYVNGCVCHLLHLAAKAGSKELHKDIEGVLIDIYYFLDKSTKRQKEFRSFQIDCGVNLHKILKHGATRWLSLHTCVTRLIEQWEPLLLYFKAEFNSLSESQQKSSKNDRIRRVNKFFNNPTSRLYCLFLRDALPLFTSCNLAFQRDSPQIHVIMQRLHDLFTDLIVRFVKTSAIEGSKNIYSIEHWLRKNQVPREELKIGSDAKFYLCSLRSEEKITKSEEDEFIKDVRNFYSSSLNYIIAKFPLDDELLRHAEFLNIRKRSKIPEASVCFFNEKFRIVPAEKQEALLCEFAKYKLENLSEDILEQSEVDKQWHAIGQLETLDKEKKFPLLGKLSEAVLSIPHSNADSERIFSMVRKNHTEFRSSMSTDTLSSLMVMKTHLLSRDWKCFSVDLDEALLKKARSAVSDSLHK